MTQNFFEILIDLIFPKAQTSFVTLQEYGLKHLDDLGIDVWVATKYNESAIHELIHKVKIEGQYAFVKELSDIFGHNVQESFVSVGRILIVPVPPDPTRFLKNGFALSNILAQNLAENLSLDFAELLYKNQTTTKQSYLNREQRLTNLNNKIALYEVKTNIVNYDEIWIIDDITTTGATLYECQKIIQKNYPFVEVKLLALASN